MREFSLAVRKRVHAAAPPVALKQGLRKFVRTKPKVSFYQLAPTTTRFEKFKVEKTKPFKLDWSFPKTSKFTFDTFL